MVPQRDAQTKGRNRMPTVTSFTRIKSDDAEGVVKNLKEAKKIIENMEPNS
jgi:hypothetical protein